LSNVRDLIVTGADVYTVDSVRSWAQAIGVRDGRVLAVGTERDVLERMSTEGHDSGSVERLHLPGRLVVPGFQDSHIHSPFAGQNRRHVSLDHFEGREAYLAVISEYARTHPDEPWITGGGWAMEYFPGGTPDKVDLDQIIPDRPVFIFNRDVHSAWVNTRALEFGGIGAGSPDPWDGRIERYAGTDEPSGTLHEGAAYSFRDHVLPQTDSAEWEASILNAQEHLLSLGITGWQDAWVTPSTLVAYRSLAASGGLKARVVGALWWSRARGLEQIADFIEQRSGGSDERFHPTTVKIMIDGVLENHTGALLEPYCDGCGGHSDNAGLTFIEPDVLAAAVSKLDALGFQVHMHAIGDRAVRSALDAVEAARKSNGWTDNRHHIAHIQVVQPSDVARFRSLGVVANCQAYWAQSEPQMDELTLPFLGEARSRLQYPFGDLQRSGAVLAMGSDWGVTTANPLEQIEVAVTRVGPKHRGVEPFLSHQRLDLPTALAAFTAGSAYVNHDDAGGSLEPGKRGDFAILDHNVFATGSLPSDATVEFTVVQGQVVYTRH
jgi:predicted amidohydrolase YtcJ